MPADDQNSTPAFDSSLLVPFAGEHPPAPDWFHKAIEAEYETCFVDVNGTDIHYQRWGDRQKPGLLLVHGNGAHAHWYDFIAPFLTDTHHVVAMTFGGMGDSGRREQYCMNTFSEEQLVVCEDAGFFAHERKPIIVGHSFGGYVTMRTGALHGDRFGGIIVADSPVRPPDDKWDGPPRRATTLRLYPDLAKALARFRLAPEQSCPNLFIVDHIARYSLRKVEDETGTRGWTWKFDPFIWQRFATSKSPSDMLRAITCPLAIIRGEESKLVDARIWDYMRILRDDMTMISIPQADHHVMLDQPLAFVAALRAQLANWDQCAA